jgi:DNA-binding NtrC family response regulator
VRILIVDDEPKLGRVLGEMLESAGHEVVRAGGGRAALERLAAETVETAEAVEAVGAFDVVLTDLRMPEVDGMAVLRAVRQTAPHTDVVMMTAYATAQNAVEAMKEGAVDYLIKPIAMDELRLRIARIAERRALSARAITLERRLDAREGFGRVVAESAKLRALVAQARQAAATDETVLLLGESGTGKNLFARAIHHASRRADGPFVEVHAAALPESLVEGELFGHERGAGAGAGAGAGVGVAKAGHAELARGGTLFLDEIGELPAAVQVKLLRLLEDRSFTRLGASEPRSADVRIIAATNRDLEATVRAGAFREDLYYRLAVFPLVLPPLRERPEDVRAIALALLAARGLGPGLGSGSESERITPAALVALAAHAWPGNVRELENAITRALVLAGAEPIGLEHLPASVGRAGPSAPASVEELLVPGFSLDALERELIQQALVKAGGNKTAAARLLGITRRRLYSRLESQREGLRGGDDDGGDERG